MKTRTKILLVVMTLWGSGIAASRPSILSSDRGSDRVEESLRSKVVLQVLEKRKASLVHRSAAHSLLMQPGQAGPAKEDDVEEFTHERKVRSRKDVDRPRASQYADNMQDDDDDTELEEDYSPERPGVLVMVEKTFKRHDGTRFRKNVLVEVSYEYAIEVIQQHLEELLYGKR